MKERVRRVPLSPNEEARLIREEKERRRKGRLVQVRQQAKQIAATIRQEVKDEREKQLSILAAEIKYEWEAEKAEKVRKLQELHLRSLRHVGDAHVNATQQETPDVERYLIEQQNLQRAAQRHLEAIKKMKEDKQRKEQEANKYIVTRQAALDQEKERAAEVAALPPPQPDPIRDVDVPKVHPIKLTDVNAFSLTHYHMEEYAVERAMSAEQTDAVMAAAKEQMRIDDMAESEKIAAHERIEKAHLRHTVARKKEMLSHDYQAMLLDLSDLRRSDIVRRQKVVAKIPKSVYQAPHRRLEEKEEEQREMEAAFEDMYMAATEHQGDLTLALDHHLPHAVTPASSSALDLSIGPAEVPLEDGDGNSYQRPPPLRHPLKDVTNLSKRILGKGNVSALERLTSKIQAQREQSAAHTPSIADSPQDQRIFAPVAQDMSSTTTGGSLSQHTLTSDTALSRSLTTMDEESTDVSSVTTLTGSRVSSTIPSQVSSVTVTDSDITTTTADTLEEGTISSTGASSLKSDTLLHPIEVAAKVRRRPLDDGLANMSPFLSQRKPGFQPNLERQVNELRQEQQRIDWERKKLEQKLKDLEASSALKAQQSSQQLAERYQEDNLREHYLLTQENADRQATVSVPEFDSIQSFARLSIPVEEKVRLYQQRSVELYKERQRSRDGSICVDSCHFGSAADQADKARLENVSAVLSSSSSSSSARSGMGLALPTVGSPYSGKSGDTERSQQSNHSKEFDARQAALKAQLAEIQHQRSDIMASQQRHQDEMTKSELVQYSLSDPLNATTIPSHAEFLEATAGGPDAIEEELMLNLNTLPPRATDHKYKINRKKPMSKVIKIPNKSPLIAHELSTIQELDTPATDKKAISLHSNSTALTGRENGEKAVSRSLFEEFPAIQEVNDSPSITSELPTFAKYKPPAHIAFTEDTLFEAPYRDLPRTPQQLSQHFTKDPSEADALSSGRNDDFSENYGDCDVPTWVGLESKVMEHPMPRPCTDRVVEVQRLSHETLGELVITPSLHPTQDPAAFSINTTLSAGIITEDSEYHPYSTGITISPRIDEVDENLMDLPSEDVSPKHVHPDEQAEAPTAESPKVPRSPNHQFGESETPPRPGFSSLYVPLQGKEKQTDWKKELARYHVSYLTPPKMSPARNTDKIQRCITTRAFGCERPIKGTAKTKQEMEAKHKANLMPTAPMRKLLSAEENMSPSQIREMFESVSKDPFQSPILRDKPPKGFAERGQFLSSTPSNAKTVTHLGVEEGKGEAGTGKTTEMGQASAEGHSQSKTDVRPSMASIDSISMITPGDKSRQSELSQHPLDSNSDMTLIPFCMTMQTDGSLEQGPLSSSRVGSETLQSAMSLSQHTLEDSSRISGTSSSPPVSNPRYLAYHGGTSNFQPLMEMSRSSDWSACSNQKSSYPVSDDFDAYTSPHVMSQTGWRSKPYSQFTRPLTIGAQPMSETGSMVPEYTVHSQQFSAGPDQNAVDLATEISQRAEIAMEKYDRLIEQSRKIREQYEAEEQVLMVETAALTGNRQSGTSYQQQHDASGNVWEHHLSRSLKKLVEEETGISEEPDLTLVSITSTPQRAMLDPQKCSQSSSYPSFKQHERSVATMSQVSPTQPSPSAEGAAARSCDASRIQGLSAELLMPNASSTMGSALSMSGHVAANTGRGLAAEKSGTHKLSMVQESGSHLKGTLASWKKNNSLQGYNDSSSVSSSSAKSTHRTGSTASSMSSVSMTTKTSADARKKERETKARTERLYSQLNDVKAQRQEQQRQEEYAANRQRKVDYQKKQQEQMKKKIQAKKE